MMILKKFCTCWIYEENHLKNIIVCYISYEYDLYSIGIIQFNI